MKTLGRKICELGGGTPGMPTISEQFATDKYTFVKGVVPKPLLRFFKTYYDIQMRNERMPRDEQCPLSFSRYGDPALETMLEFCRPAFEKASGLELVPTYSYTRVYVKGDILARHKDRPACEVSATVCLHVPKGSQSIIWVKNPSGKEIDLDMNEGDACLYLGCEIEHWRDPIPETGITQAFLHYINKNGPFFPEHKYDGRVRLGSEKQAAV